MRPLVMLLLPLALAACHREPAADPPVPASDAPPAAATAADSAAVDNPRALEAHHWRLRSAAGGDGQPLQALSVAELPPLVADFRDGRIGLSGGCNRGSASYAVENGTLQVEDFAQTMMACSDARLMAVDAEATRALAGTLRWQLDTVAGGDTPTLVLINAGGDTLTFEGAPTAETRHGGPGETVFLEVAPERMACSHPLMPDHQCLQVREVRYDDNGLRQGEPGDWQPLYEDIEGYTHEPGVRNVLRLKRFQRTDVPADASSIAYVLDMTVETESTQ